MGNSLLRAQSLRAERCRGRGRGCRAELGAASSKRLKATLSVVSLQRNKSVPGFIHKKGVKWKNLEGHRVQTKLLMDDAPGLAVLSCNRYLSIGEGFARAAEMTRGLVYLMEINAISVS